MQNSFKLQSRKAQDQEIPEDRLKKLSKEFGKPLDIGKANKQLWLVKIPAQIADEWDSARDGALLGNLTLTKTPGSNQPKFDIQLKDMPIQYNLEQMNAGSRMLAFSHNEDGEIGVDGKVTRSFTMQPKRDQAYHKMCRKRTIKALKPKRTIQPLDDSEIRKPGVKSNIVFDFSGQGTKRKGDIFSDAKPKKIKMDKAELRSLLFQKFAEKEQWTTAELNADLHQPDKYLGETLHEICIKQKRGIWELKPEYKVTVPTPSAEAGETENS
mmetsp:Transcript_33942/g.43612  ORF Transcript_33942/g.43612 Transcript_33942/m.43612 type:complete len:269 (-) Transcript_33942:142-948(-)